jgi:hypothetical protein
MHSLGSEVKHCHRAMNEWLTVKLLVVQVGGCSLGCHRICAAGSGSHRGHARQVSHECRFVGARAHTPSAALWLHAGSALHQMYPKLVPRIEGKRSLVSVPAILLPPARESQLLLKHGD